MHKREREVDIESLKLFFLHPERWDSQPSPFNSLLRNHALAHTSAVVQLMLLCLRIFTSTTFHNYSIVKFPVMLLLMLDFIKMCNISLFLCYNSTRDLQHQASLYY